MGKGGAHEIGNEKHRWLTIKGIGDVLNYARNHGLLETRTYLRGRESQNELSKQVVNTKLEGGECSVVLWSKWMSEGDLRWYGAVSLCVCG